MSNFKQKSFFASLIINGIYLLHHFDSNTCRVSYVCVAYIRTFIFTYIKFACK